MVTVFQFERYDPLIKHVRRSDYFATDDAIQKSIVGVYGK